MLVVKVELHSALTGLVTEIGRAYIANDGTGSDESGNYKVAVCRKGSTRKPWGEDAVAPTREGRVDGYPRLSYPVWRLVCRALRSCFPEEQ